MKNDIVDEESNQGDRRDLVRRMTSGHFLGIYLKSFSEISVIIVGNLQTETGCNQKSTTT